MKMRTKAIFLSVMVLLVAACGGSDSKREAVAYKEVSGYFVRNDVENKEFSEKITDLKRFEELFGMAATMSSRPTEIDFNKQFVAAIVMPVTYDATDMLVDSVIRNEGKMTVYYSVETGARQTYSVRPNLLLSINKKYDGRLETVMNGNKQKQQGYLILNIVDGKATATVSKNEREHVVFAFEPGDRKKLKGALSSPDSVANIRFTQIFMPDGTADGPFGRDIEYDLVQNGLYKLSVGENMMAGDPWAGEFTIAIILE